MNPSGNFINRPESIVCLDVRLPRETRELVETRAKKMNISSSDLVKIALWRSGLLDKHLTHNEFLDKL